MRLPIRIPAVLVAVVVAFCLKTSPAAQPAPLTGFDDLVARAMKDWRVPGLAIAVVKDGKVVFAHGYGVRESGKPATVDTRTLFAIGSTTKAMTAALVGMLVDEKKSSGTPVIKYLPWFQLKDPAVTRELTVRDLLTHRAGLGNADYLWYGQGDSTDEILRRVRLIDPAYSGASGFIYQNIMYAAAGRVIEAAVRETVGRDDPAAHLRAARHARHHRHRCHARPAAQRRLAARRSSTAACA